MTNRSLAMAACCLGVWTSLRGKGADHHAAPPSPPPLNREIVMGPVAGRSARLAAEPVEWLIGELTDEEQKLVELINRSRANPAAEATRLRFLPEADVQAAYAPVAVRGFGVDLDSFVADVAARPAVPPLTPHSQLTTAARGHSQYMFDRVIQAHEQVDPVTGVEVNNISDRVTATGYPWGTVRESVFAYALTMEYAHAAFVVDWGDGPGGQQTPPGHRITNFAADITEVGAGVLAGVNRRIVPGKTNEVGPRVVTLDFARPNPRRTFVTGVAYYDLNGDGAYGEGEGLPGIQVNVAGAEFFARTTTAGGYGVPVSDGARTVTFSAANLAPITRTVTVAGESVKVDIALPYAAPALVGPAQPIVGRVNAYQVEGFPAATATEWRATGRAPLTAVLGAEAGVDGFTATTTGSYTPRSTLSRSAGLASYRLVHATGAPEVLTQNGELAALAGATLRFNRRFGFSTDGSIAAVEVSTDSEVTWREVWSRPGLGGTVIPGASFQPETVPLDLPVGTVFRLRFRYSVQPGKGYFNQEGDERVGFFFDEVSYTGVTVVTPAASGEVPAGQLVNFTPTTAGDFVLQARPKIGARVFPYREGKAVTSRVVPAPTAVTRINGLAFAAGGSVQVDFTRVSGVASGFDLETSATVAGPWSPVPGAVFGTTTASSFFFLTPPSGGMSFYRIRPL